MEAPMSTPAPQTLTLDEILKSHRLYIQLDDQQRITHEDITKLKAAILAEFESCLPKFSDIRADNADQMEGYRRAIVDVQQRLKKWEKHV
jgi:hypothetical protein